MSVILKLELDREIRRLTVPENELTIQFISQKCQEKFSEKLGNSRIAFSYVDEDGDKITLDSQEELIQLLIEKKNQKQPPTLHLNVEIKESPQKEVPLGHPPFHCHPRHPRPFHCHRQFQPQPQTQDQPRSPGVRHPGIVCDICQEEIIGLRYKCTICPDFDVCEKCETKESTQQIPTHSSERHLYVMLRRPVIVKESLPFSRSNPTTTVPSGSESESTKGWLSDLLDTSETSIQQQVMCDGCKKVIGSLRFKCGLCEDFDLCGDCIQFAELKHNTEHSFWLKIVPLSFSGEPRLPRLSNFYWGRPVLTQLGPILVSSKYLNSLGVSDIRIETHPSHHPYRRTQNPLRPGDIEVQMDIPIDVLAGRGGCPFVQFQQFDRQTVQLKPTQGPLPVPSSDQTQNPTPIQPQTTEVQSPAKPEPQPDQTQQIKTEPTVPDQMDMDKSQLDEGILRKCKELEEMGFTDLATNLSLLKIFDGRLEATLNHLLNEK